MGLLTGITDAIGLTDTGAAKKSMAESAAVTQAQLDRLSAIDLPDIEKQKLLLENPELIGLLEAGQIEALDGKRYTDKQLYDEYRKARQQEEDSYKYGQGLSTTEGDDPVAQDIATLSQSPLRSGN